MRFFSSEPRAGLGGLPAVGLAVVVALLALALVAAALPGCGGCRKDDQKTEAEKEAERLAKEREAEQPEFTLGAPISQPTGPKEMACRYKPGHWTSATLEAKANKDDFVGDLEILLLQNNRASPVGLDAVPYRMTDWRSVALAKGRPKSLHAAFYVPTTPEIVSAQLNLTARRGYRRIEIPFSINRMLAYQYHFVVLARAPDRYAYVRSLHSIKPPGGATDKPTDDYHYWVSLVKPEGQTPLPTDAMFWTTIAYVLWDDVDPKSLTPAQQRALVDWLHWGGQLIASGPDTLVTLRDSFLADYLPAAADGAWALKPADFDELNKNFTLTAQRPLTPLGEWSGVRLRLAEGAQFVPGTGRLAAERRVGRGRVVASAVRLSDRSLIDWQGFDGFFNACLLRRPARRYEVSDYDEMSLAWADPKLGPDDGAAVNSRLRYFSRDAGVAPAEYARCGGAAAPAAPAAPVAVLLSTGQSAIDPTETPPANGPGVAAWRAFSPAANAARGTLQNAACVEVPDCWFVIWVVAAYLAVLVPLNWFIFSVLGRTEWAWAAAPLIAIGFTVAVVHLARLDIGFARSETSVGVLEIQGSYPRAHLARYAALYTSLTTPYEFSRNDDGGSLVQPFPTVVRRDDFRLLPGQSLATLECWRDKGMRLSGFSIPSNLVDFVHAEEMVEMEGPIEMIQNARGSWDVVNRTGMPLHGVGVVRKDAAGDVETAWIGELSQMGAAPLTFARPKSGKPPWWPDRRAQSIATRKNPKKGEINLRALTELAENVDELRPGESRLVGWTDAPAGKLSIAPAAPQSRQLLLVVAHLRHAPQGRPTPDENSKEQVQPQAQGPVLEGP